MSAVSSDHPRARTDITASADHRHGNGETGTIGHQGGQHSHEPPADADFGPNEWLVDELYQRYLADPQTVDPAWWNFFADYKPDAAAAAGLGRAEVTAQAEAAEPAVGAQATGAQATGTEATGTEAAGAAGGRRPS